MGLPQGFGFLKCRIEWCVIRKNPTKLQQVFRALKELDISRASVGSRGGVPNFGSF